MRPPMFMALVGVAALSGACREPKCHGELEPDDLQKLLEQVEQGKDPCPEHLRPSIELSRAGLSLNGRSLVPAEQLVHEYPRRIQPLFADLKNAREIWKQLHPGSPFEAEPALRIDGDVGAAPAASVIITTAFAGYPFQKIKLGATVLDLDYAVPGPPNPEGVRQSVELHIGATTAGRRSVRLMRGTHGSLAEIVSFEDVPAAVEKVCRGERRPCADVLVVTPYGDFGATATLLYNVMRSSVFGGRRPVVRFLGGGQ